MQCVNWVTGVDAEGAARWKINRRKANPEDTTLAANWGFAGMQELQKGPTEKGPGGGSHRGQSSSRSCASRESVPGSTTPGALIRESAAEGKPRRVLAATLVMAASTLPAGRQPAP